MKRHERRARILEVLQDGELGAVEVARLVLSASPTATVREMGSDYKAIRNDLKSMVSKGRLTETGEGTDRAFMLASERKTTPTPTPTPTPTVMGVRVDEPPPMRPVSSSPWEEMTREVYLKHELADIHADLEAARVAMSFTAAANLHLRARQTRADLDEHMREIQENGGPPTPLEDEEDAGVLDLFLEVIRESPESIFARIEEEVHRRRSFLDADDEDDEADA